MKLQPELTNSDTLFLANWERALFVHFQVPSEQLQPIIPFELDLYDRHAYVSLVAFTMSHFRPRFGGKLLGWLTRPFGNHSFLNIRAYVKRGNEAGIYFMKEFVTRRMNIPLGRMLYGLPYHYGHLYYQHHHERGLIEGTTSDPEKKARLCYSAEIESGVELKPAVPTSLDEFLMERYTAFTCWRENARLFRINHGPWPQTRIDLNITDDSLLQIEGCFSDAKLICANYSPGLNGVQMGRPQRVA